MARGRCRTLDPALPTHQVSVMLDVHIRTGPNGQLGEYRRRPERPRLHSQRDPARTAFQVRLRTTSRQGAPAPSQHRAACDESPAAFNQPFDSGGHPSRAGASPRILVHHILHADFEDVPLIVESRGPTAARCNTWCKARRSSSISRGRSVTSAVAARAGRAAGRRGRCWRRAIRSLAR